MLDAVTDTATGEQITPRDLAARLRRHGAGLTVVEADVLGVDFRAPQLGLGD